MIRTVFTAQIFQMGAGLSGYIAEMATAFICASLGIVPTVRHADYIGNWLAVLKEDAKAIVRAASLASKACEFILQFKAEAKSTTDMEQAA